MVINPQKSLNNMMKLLNHLFFVCKLYKYWIYFYTRGIVTQNPLLATLAIVAFKDNCYCNCSEKLTEKDCEYEVVTGCMGFVVNRATETQLPVRLLSVFKLKMTDNITVIK